MQVDSVEIYRDLVEVTGRQIPTNRCGRSVELGQEMLRMPGIVTSRRSERERRLAAQALCVAAAGVASSQKWSRGNGRGIG
jgi:hypothetical protein